MKRMGDVVICQINRLLYSTIMYIQVAYVKSVLFVHPGGHQEGEHCDCLPYNPLGLTAAF